MHSRHYSTYRWHRNHQGDKSAVYQGMGGQPVEPIHLRLLAWGWLKRSMSVLPSRHRIGLQGEVGEGMSTE
jgi:hypothetical protein